MLVRSILSFSHNSVYPIKEGFQHLTMKLSSANSFNLDMAEISSPGNMFNPFLNKPWFFLCLLYKSFENTVRKGEIARNEKFLLFPQS